jgi:hypothetical protein
MAPLKGKEWYLARVKKFTEDFPGVVGDAMFEEATNIARASQEQCPVYVGKRYLGGTLRASFFMTQSGTKENPKVMLGYGTKYAVYVHEKVDDHHPVGKAKFLEDPIIAARPMWLRNVWARANKARLGGK